MELGRIGIWQGVQAGPGAVPEMEALGYGAVWLGFNPSVEDARAFVEAGTTLPVATGILNVWQHEPAAVAAAHARLVADHPGRFVLGIGIGHSEVTAHYARPLSTMREYFDGLDAAETPVPRGQRVADALGPKMLDLAAERSLGAHPYFSPVEHTRFARERVGEGVLVAPELAVVIEEDAETARGIAREYARGYLRLTNYRTNLLRFGFTEDDVSDGGSDGLIDAVIPHGSAEQVAEAVRAHLDAGADHVCLQPLGHGALPVADYRALAKVLL
jgi:probable F420-dependent oxidoreductase